MSRSGQRPGSDGDADRRRRLAADGGLLFLPIFDALGAGGDGAGADGRRSA